MLKAQTERDALKAQAANRSTPAAQAQRTVDAAASKGVDLRPLFDWSGFDAQTVERLTRLRDRGEYAALAVAVGNARLAASK